MDPELEFHAVPAFIVDTPEGIELFRLLALKHALALEIKTGLRHSTVSVLRSTNVVLMRNGWIDAPFKRKGAALEALDLYIEDRQWAMYDDEETVCARLLNLLTERRGTDGMMNWDAMSPLERHGCAWAWEVVSGGDRVPEIACGSWYYEHPDGRP